MHLTDNTELTDAQTRDLVRRGVAKGRRMNTTRRAVSGIAALAVVGALSIGAFSVMGAISPDDVAPAAPLAPMAPQEAPFEPAPDSRVEGQENGSDRVVRPTPVKVDPKDDASEKDASQRGEDPNPPTPNMSTSQELKAALEEVLPGAKVKLADGGSTTDYAATVKIPTDDGYATADVFLFNGSGEDGFGDGPGMQQVDGLNVWYFAGSSDDKEGQHDWYFQREDGAQITFYLSTIERSGEDGKTITSTTSTRPLSQQEMAQMLASPAWDTVLDEMMAATS